MSKKFETELQIVEKYFRYLNSQDIILRSIKTYKVLHGGGIRYQKDEKAAHSPLREIMTDISFRHEVILNFDLETFCVNLFDMVKKRIEQLHKLLYDEILSATELTGNQVDARGSKLNQDIVLDMLEKIDISFDKDGNPKLPQLHVAPETYELIKNMKNSPGQEKRYNSIIEEKKKLWYAKKRYRKLSYIN